MGISAIRRPMVFHSRIATFLPSDCEKPAKETTSKRPRNGFETTSAGALVKRSILAKMCISPREFGHVLEWGLGRRGDLQSPCPIPFPVNVQTIKKELRLKC